MKLTIPVLYNGISNVIVNISFLSFNSYTAIIGKKLISMICISKNHNFQIIGKCKHNEIHVSSRNIIICDIMQAVTKADIHENKASRRHDDIVKLREPSRVSHFIYTRALRFYNYEKSTMKIIVGITSRQTFTIFLTFSDHSSSNF